MKVEGIDFDAAKLRVAELLGRRDLIRERSAGPRSQATDAESLLNPPLQDRDDRLAANYLAHRLQVSPDAVAMPTTPVVGLKALGYYDAPAQGRGRPPKPVHVGDFPCAVARAGTLGLPLMVAIIGGSFERFRPLVDLYRESGRRAGHKPQQLVVGVHAMGFVGETSAKAKDAFFPGWAHMVATIGRERGWAPPSRQQFEATCGPGGAYLIGDPQTVARKMLTASDALGGISRITFQMSSASLETAAMKRSIELLGGEVAPIVRAAQAKR